MIYVVAKQHPTLPEVSMFATEDKADADRYRAIGWTVLEIAAPQPVQPAPLTDLRISELWPGTSYQDCSKWHVYNFARAIEAAVRTGGAG